MAVKPGDKIGLWRVLAAPERQRKGKPRALCLCTGCGREKMVFIYSIGRDSFGCVACRNGRAHPTPAEVYEMHKAGRTYKQIKVKFNPISLATIHRKLVKAYRERAIQARAVDKPGALPV